MGYLSIQGSIVKKRLRKKRHVGEFRQYCFQVSGRFANSLTEPQIDRFSDDFIDLIEGLHLQTGGSVDAGGFDYIVQCALKNNDPTAADRDAVTSWLSNHPLTTDLYAGPLRDANYGWSN